MRLSLRFGILLLLAGLLLVGPASAEIQQNPIPIPDLDKFVEEDTNSLDFDVQAGGRAIATVFFWGVKPDTCVNFTLYYGDTALPGSVDYARNGWGYTKTFTLDNQVSSYDGGWPALGAGFCVYYGKDAATGKTYLSIGDAPPFGEDQRLWVETSGVQYAPVHRVEVEASHPIKVEIRHGDPQTIMDSIRTYGSDSNGLDDWVGTLLDFVGTIWDLVYGVILLFKTLLIDRWLQVLVVFESVAIGHSCYHARDFIGFIRNFTRVNEKAITLVAGIIAWIMEFFFKLIQAIKPL